MRVSIEIATFGVSPIPYFLGENLFVGFLKWGTPKSSILVGFSLVNHPFLGIPYLWKSPSVTFVRNFPSLLRYSWGAPHGQRGWGVDGLVRGSMVQLACGVQEKQGVWRLGKSGWNEGERLSAGYGGPFFQRDMMSADIMARLGTSGTWFSWQVGAVMDELWWCSLYAGYQIGKRWWQELQ